MRCLHISRAAGWRSVLEAHGVITRYHVPLHSITYGCKRPGRCCRDAHGSLCRWPSKMSSSSTCRRMTNRGLEHSHGACNLAQQRLQAAVRYNGAHSALSKLCLPALQRRVACTTCNSHAISPPLAQRYKAGVQEMFDARHASYAENFSSFHGPLVDTLVSLAPLQPGQKVLDVATGTGAAACAAAAIVGNEGSVLGIDISSGMIRQVGAPSCHIVNSRLCMYWYKRWMGLGGQNAGTH